MIRAVVADQVGRVGGEERGTLAVHESLDALGVGAVGAEQAVARAHVCPERDQIARLRDRLGVRGREGIGIKAVRVSQEPFRGRQELVDERAGLGDIEAGQSELEVWRFEQVVEQRGQGRLVPAARDLVEREVEGLLFILRQVDDADIDLGCAAGLEDGQTLVAADEVAGALVPDQRLDAAELVHGAGEAFVVGVAGLEGDAWVVRGGVEGVDQDAADSEMHGRVLRVGCARRASRNNSETPSRHRHFINMCVS